MKKTTKKRIDEIIGITILVIIGLFVGRHFLSGVEGYKKIEAKVSSTLKLPEIKEKVVKALNLGDERDIEEYQRKREAKLTAQKRPDFGIKVPLGKKVVSKYEIAPLFDEGYYPALKSAIRNARESIYVAMFVISMGKKANNPVNSLLNELISAKMRGVDVKVVVENPPSSTNSLYKKNEEAILYLRNGGVEASFDDPKTEVHDKFILIDEKILFIGNHNWSKQALTINREISVIVKAHPANPEFLKHFAHVKLARPEETKEGKIKLIKELYKELLQRGQAGFSEINAKGNINLIAKNVKKKIERVREKDYLIPLVHFTKVNSLAFLPKGKYFDCLYEAIDSSKKSIYIAMFTTTPSLSENHPIGRIIIRLIQAKRKGVDVKILLGTSFSKDIDRKNLRTSELLEKAGIEVKFDKKGGPIMHGKLVIIDDEKIIVGSHNWTRAACEHNSEASVMISSKEASVSFKKYFNKWFNRAETKISQRE